VILLTFPAFFGSFEPKAFLPSTVILSHCHRHHLSLSENSKNKKKKRSCEEIRFKTSFFAAPLLFMYKSDLIFSTDIPLYGNYQNNTKIGVSQCVVLLDFMRIFRNT